MSEEESTKTESSQAPENFLPLTALVEAVIKQQEEEFLEAHPEALLLVDNPGSEVENASFQTIAAGSSGDAQSKQDKLIQGLGSARYVFVLKKSKNKFASMITTGRAANNDMRLNVPSVSKFHAYFTHVARDACWYLADANSSNGTFIDGEELPPSHGKVKLKSGSTLRFGPDVTAKYYEAGGFWKELNTRLEDMSDQGES